MNGNGCTGSEYWTFPVPVPKAMSDNRRWPEVGRETTERSRGVKRVRQNVCSCLVGGFGDFILINSRTLA